MSLKRRAVVALSLIAASGLNSCSNESTAPLQTPQTGTLEVHTSTTGRDLDGDGYSLDFNGPTSMRRDIGVNAFASLTLAAGSYSVALGAVRFNCQVRGANPHTVEVPEGLGKVSVQFDVDCTQRPVASLLIVPKPTSLGVGESLQLSARTFDREGASLDGLPVTWASSAEAQATVSPTGLVLGVAHGSVTITATVEGKTQGFTLEIGDPAASLTLDPTSITLSGNTCNAPLTAVLRNAQGQEITGRQVNWSTSNGQFAVLSDPLDGPVSAVSVIARGGPGTETVTASTGLLASSGTVTVAADLIFFCFI